MSYLKRLSLVRGRPHLRLWLVGDSTDYCRANKVVRWSGPGAPSRRDSHHRARLGPTLDELNDSAMDKANEPADRCLAGREGTIPLACQIDPERGRCYAGVPLDSIASGDGLYHASVMVKSYQGALTLGEPDPAGSGSGSGALVCGYSLGLPPRNGRWTRELTAAVAAVGTGLVALWCLRAYGLCCLSQSIRWGPRWRPRCP